MNGVDHVALGLLAGTATAQVLEVPHGLGVIAMCLAATTSAGSLSPDMDLRWSGMFAHRRFTHWWLPALLVAGLAHWQLTGWNPATWWIVPALLAGWLSHLLGDLAFGRESEHRDAGIPMAGPMHGYVGLGLKSGGIAEKVVTFALVWPAWWMASYTYTGLSPLGFAVLVLVVLAIDVLISAKKSKKRSRR